MRIIYCPRHHRVEVHSQHHGDPTPPGTEYVLGGAHPTCDACMALIERRRPAKAKRTGES